MIALIVPLGEVSAGLPTNPIAPGGVPPHPSQGPGFPTNPIAPGGPPPFPSQGPGFPTNPIAPGGAPPQPTQPIYLPGSNHPVQLPVFPVNPAHPIAGNGGAWVVAMVPGYGWAWVSVKPEVPPTEPEPK